ncbi:MAG: hydrolase [Vicinamibacterales bacterium]
MQTGTVRVLLASCVTALLVAGVCLRVPATAQGPADALTGEVRSKAEGRMEGVVVIAQRQGSTVLTSVVTNELGQYRFPRNRMAAGRHTIFVRAAGYVLPGTGTASVEVAAQGSARLNLLLDTATEDQLAHQLTSVDWWTSMPGTTAQKDLLVRKIVNCGFCHEMERVMRSRYTADQWLPVIQRMSTYAADNSSACGTGSTLTCDAKTMGRVQFSSKPAPMETLSYGGADAKALARYLASVNLSGGRKTWDFPLKAMPRPKGKATRVIVTVYPSPRQPSVIHDLDVDAKGHVWYGDSGWGYLGMLDPATGMFREYLAPNTWPDPQPGLKRLVGVQDVTVDPAGHVWAVVGFLGRSMATFNPGTGKWTQFPMPAPVWAFLPPFHKGQQETIWTTGQMAQPDGSAPLTAYRLNATTGKVDAAHRVMVDKTGKDVSGPRPFGPFGIATVRPFCYQVDRDPADNFYCADFYGSNIIRVDARTGATAVFPTPTPNAAPRRGRTDNDGRFWFGEFWGDKLGLFDPATQSIREFPYSTKYMSAYAAASDRHGEGWGSSTGSDRVVRVNPKTGETTEYLMPVYYDARKVAVDDSAASTTVWLPNKNLAQLIRIEPLD